MASTATATMTLDEFLATYAGVGVWWVSVAQPTGYELRVNTGDDVADEDYCDGPTLLETVPPGAGEIEGTVSRFGDHEWRWEVKSLQDVDLRDPFCRSTIRDLVVYGREEDLHLASEDADPAMVGTITEDRIRAAILEAHRTSLRRAFDTLHSCWAYVLVDPSGDVRAGVDISPQSLEPTDDDPRFRREHRAAIVWSREVPPAPSTDQMAEVEDWSRADEEAWLDVNTPSHRELSEALAPTGLRLAD